MKNRLKFNSDEELSIADRQILDDRYKELKEKDKKMINLVDLKEELLKKYRS